VAGDDDGCAAATPITEQHIKIISATERPMSNFLCVGACPFNIAIVVSSAIRLSIFSVRMAQSRQHVDANNSFIIIAIFFCVALV
jgi:Ca2+/Na+ antiporter